MVVAGAFSQAATHQLYAFNLPGIEALSYFPHAVKFGGFSRALLGAASVLTPILDGAPEKAPFLVPLIATALSALATVVPFSVMSSEFSLWVIQSVLPMMKSLHNYPTALAASLHILEGYVPHARWWLNRL